MGIVTLLMAMAAPGLFKARDQYVLDAEAEKVLMAVREIQNKSIAVARDRAGNETKVWAIHFNPALNRYLVVSLYDSASEVQTNHFVERTENLPIGMTLATSIAGNPALYFSAPFGTSYITNSTMNGMGNGTCRFVTDSSRPLKDYYIADGLKNVAACSTTYSSIKVDPSRAINITLSYKGNIKTIEVKSNGDAYLY